MQRRDVAAAPLRGAPDTWQVIRRLVVDTVAHSEQFTHADVEAALEPVEVVGRMLIAAGHLERDAMVLVVGAARIDMFTVSGDSVMTLSENLHAATGAIGATDWTLYLPQVEPMVRLVRTAIEGRAHLSDDVPAERAIGEIARSSSLLDLDALARWAQEEA